MANPPSVARAAPKFFPCTCKHDYQDQKYGRQVRICNPTAKGNPGNEGPKSYKCTVCGALRP